MLYRWKNRSLNWKSMAISFVGRFCFFKPLWSFNSPCYKKGSWQLHKTSLNFHNILAAFLLFGHHNYEKQHVHKTERGVKISRVNTLLPGIFPSQIKDMFQEGWVEAENHWRRMRTIITAAKQEQVEQRKRKLTLNIQWFSIQYMYIACVYKWIIASCVWDCQSSSCVCNQGQHRHPTLGSTSVNLVRNLLERLVSTRHGVTCEFLKQE